VRNSMAMSPRTTPTEITTKNKKEISNRNSAGAESDSSIDLAIKELVGAVGEGQQTVCYVERKEEFSPVNRALQVCGIAPGIHAHRDNN